MGFCRQLWLLKWHASIVVELLDVTHILSYKQDGQYTCNITLRHIRVTTVAMEDQQVLNMTNMRLYSRFVIWYANFLFCVLYHIVICGVSGSTICFHIIL
jgi:hypothetical protein